MKKSPRLLRSGSELDGERHAPPRCQIAPRAIKPAARRGRSHWRRRRRWTHERFGDERTIEEIAMRPRIAVVRNRRQRGGPGGGHVALAPSPSGWRRHGFRGATDGLADAWRPQRCFGSFSRAAKYGPMTSARVLSQSRVSVSHATAGHKGASIRSSVKWRRRSSSSWSDVQIQLCRYSVHLLHKFVEAAGAVVKSNSEDPLRPMAPFAALAASVRPTTCGTIVWCCSFASTYCLTSIARTSVSLI